MASRAEDSEPPGKVRYKRIEEKIQHLTRHNIERETKEILEILDEGNIIYHKYKNPFFYSEEPSIMERLVGKTGDLYLEPSFAKLVQTMHPSYEASKLANKEALAHIVWSNTELVTSDSIVRETIAKLKIYTPLDQELCTQCLQWYIHYCDIDKEWNSHYVGLLTFLIKEGADPFDPVKRYNSSAFSWFLLQFSSHLSDSLMLSVTTFLEEAFKKLEVSRNKESIMYDIIEDLPIEIIRGDSIHLSSLKELIVRNCLEIIKRNPNLCDYEDTEGKTPLHKLMEIILEDDLLKEMPGLVAGTDKLWDLMSGLITNKNVNIKGKDKVTPYSWILWWQNSVTDLQTFDAENEKLAKRIQDMKKQFQEKGASEEDALDGVMYMKRSKAPPTLDMALFKKKFKSPGKVRSSTQQTVDMASRAEVLGAPGEVRYTRIEEKIRNLTRSNIDQETKEILEILDEGNIIYPARGPSIMKWLVRKIDDLYQEPSYAELVQTLHSSYKASAPSKEEHLGLMVWYQLRGGATDLSDLKRRIYVSSDSIAREVIAKLKIYTPLDQELCTRILWKYIYYCDKEEKEWNPNFVDLLTFLTREGGDPFRLLGPEDEPPIITAFTLFLGRLSSYLSQKLMPSVSSFLEEAFKKWEVSISKESILNDVIKYIPNNIVEGDSIHFSSVKGLIVANCLRIIATKPSLCDHEDGGGKTPLHRLMERVQADGLWKMIPDLVRGTDKLWDLMSGLITNKNVNIKDKNGVTPYTWILWWQKSLTDFQTVDSLKRQKLASKIEDVKKHFQEKGASEEDALQGLKNLKTTSPYRRIKEKIDNLTKLNVEREAKEILQMIEEEEIIYPTQGPSIMKKLIGKTDELYLEPSFANLIKTLHSSYKESALAREEDLTNMVYDQLRYGATDWSKSNGKIWINNKSIARDVMAKIKIYTPLDRMLSTRILWTYIYFCDINKEWNSDFVGLLTFLIREGADPFHPLGPGGKPPIETAFKECLEKFSPHLSDSLMPSVSTFLEEAFKKWENSETKESIMYDIIKNLPIEIIRGDSIHLSSIKELIVRNCLDIIKTNPHLCDYGDREGKTPLHKLMEKILMDHLWKEMPGLAAGTDKLWDLMSGLITNKNVNIKDEDKVTPYSWILWLQNSVTDLQTFDARQKQKLAKKIEDVKKQFQEKRASEEDALQGLNSIKNIKRHRRIEEKIRHLTRSNIEQEAKEILEILDEENIIYPPKGPSIMKQLVGKTDDLYLEPSFATLVQTLHPSYEASELAKKENLAHLVWSKTKWITSDSTARESIAKLKIYTPLGQWLCTGILEKYIFFCNIDKEWNSHFVGLLTFLIKEGADPFHPQGYASAFSWFLEKCSSHLSDSLMPSVTTFLEEAFKKWEVSRKKESILYDIIEDLPMEIIRGDSIHLSSLKEHIVRNCLEIIKTNPHLCDYQDTEGKTPLHKLIETILKDDLWKSMPGLVAGTDKLWNLMPGLITNMNVNIKDKDKVAPYSLILWWQNSVTDLQIIDADKNEKLAKKIQDVKKQFREKGASEEDALDGVIYMKGIAGQKIMEKGEMREHLKKMIQFNEKKEELWRRERTYEGMMAKLDKEMTLTKLEIQNIMTKSLTWNEHLTLLTEHWPVVALHVGTLEIFAHLRRHLFEARCAKHIHCGQYLTGLKEKVDFEEFAKRHLEIKNDHILDISKGILEVITDKDSSQTIYNVFMKCGIERNKRGFEINNYALFDAIRRCIDKGAFPKTHDILEISSYVAECRDNEALLVTLQMIKHLIHAYRKQGTREVIAIYLNSVQDQWLVRKDLRRVACKVIREAYMTLSNCMESNSVINSLLYMGSCNDGKDKITKFFGITEDRLQRDRMKPPVTRWIKENDDDEDEEKQETELRWTVIKRNDNWLKRNVLHLAAIFCHNEDILKCIPKEVVKRLINERDIHGCTALHIAHLHDNKPAIRFLESHNAKVEKDYFGKTPQDLKHYLDKSQEYNEENYDRCATAETISFECMKWLLVLPEEECKSIKKDLRKLFKGIMAETISVQMGGSVREKLKVGRWNEFDLQIVTENKLYENEPFGCLKCHEFLVKRLTDVNLENISLRCVSVSTPWLFIWEGEGSQNGQEISVDVVPVAVVEKKLTKHRRQDLIVDNAPGHMSQEYLKWKLLKKDMQWSPTIFLHEWDILDNLPPDCRIGIQIAKALLEMLEQHRGKKKKHNHSQKNRVTSYIIKNTLFWLLAGQTPKKILGDHENIIGKRYVDCQRQIPFRTNTPEGTNEQHLERHAERGKVWAEKIFDTIKTLALMYKIVPGSFLEDNCYPLYYDYEVIDVLDTCEKCLKLLNTMDSENSASRSHSASSEWECVVS